MKLALPFILLFTIFYAINIDGQQLHPTSKAQTHQGKMIKPSKHLSHKKKATSKKHSSLKKKKVTPHSTHVYINNHGSVEIHLPNAKTKAYKLIFFNTDKRPLFTIQKVMEPILVLEKGNFLQEGWFGYELFEEGKLIEKNQFQLTKH